MCRPRLIHCQLAHNVYWGYYWLFCSWFHKVELTACHSFLYLAWYFQSKQKSGLISAFKIEIKITQLSQLTIANELEINGLRYSNISRVAGFFTVRLLLLTLHYSLTIMPNSGIHKCGNWVLKIPQLWACKNLPKNTNSFTVGEYNWKLNWDESEFFLWDVKVMLWSAFLKSHIRFRFHEVFSKFWVFSLNNQ